MAYIGEKGERQRSIYIILSLYIKRGGNAESRAITGFVFFLNAGHLDFSSVYLSIFPLFPRFLIFIKKLTTTQETQ